MTRSPCRPRRCHPLTPSDRRWPTTSRLGHARPSGPSLGHVCHACGGGVRGDRQSGHARPCQRALGHAAAFATRRAGPPLPAPNQAGTRSRSQAVSWMSRMALHRVRGRGCRGARATSLARGQMQQLPRRGCLALTRNACQLTLAARQVPAVPRKTRATRPSTVMVGGWRRHAKARGTQVRPATPKTGRSGVA